jgi:hypothetical protein
MAVSYPGHTAGFIKESRDIFGYTSWQFVDGNKSTEVLNTVGGETLAGKLGTSPAADPEAPAYQSFARSTRRRSATTASHRSRPILTTRPRPSGSRSPKRSPTA